LNTVNRDYEEVYPPNSNNRPKANNHLSGRTIATHLGLFLLTFTMVTLAGANFVGFSGSLFPFGLPNTTDMFRGALFASLLLGFLGVHEFGHYFASLYHKIKVTLPYFIPIPLGIGTMGAVIRIKQKINDSNKLFDVGAAGPLAGFVVSLTVLLVGFATLPYASYIQQFDGHESVKTYVSQHGSYPESPQAETSGQTLTAGNTLLYGFLASFFDNVPPMWEMLHYPFLFVACSLFVFLSPWPASLLSPLFCSRWMSMASLFMLSAGLFGRAFCLFCYAKPSTIIYRGYCG